MTTIFHAWSNGRFIDTEQRKRKKAHRTDEDSNFFGGSLSNRDNVKVPFQFRRGSQP